MQLSKWIMSRLDIYSEDCFYRVGEREVTFGEVNKKSRERASFFQGVGVSYIFCDSDDIEDYIISFLACVFSRKVIVPVSKNKTRIEVFKEQYSGAAYWNGTSLTEDFTGRKTLKCESGDVYCLFTSGSTGEPKGIIVNQKNLKAYIENVSDLGIFSRPKLISCNFNPVFDLFYHDLLVSVENGLIMQIPTVREGMIRQEYFNNYKFDIWFSTPTHIANIIKSVDLSNSLISLFCGEALPSKLLSDWFDKTNSELAFNLYGPTECTIAVTAYKAHVKDCGWTSCGVVPIGAPFGKNILRLNSDSIVEIIGSQVARYLSEEGGGYYELGCDVFNTEDKASYDSQGYHFLGRTDKQIKINGNRVELGELHLHALSIVGVESAIVEPVSNGIIYTGFIIHYIGKASKDDIVFSYLNKFNGVFSPCSVYRHEFFKTNASGKAIAKEKF